MAEHMSVWQGMGERTEMPPSTDEMPHVLYLHTLLSVSALTAPRHIFTHRCALATHVCARLTRTQRSKTKVKEVPGRTTNPGYVTPPPLPPCFSCLCHTILHHTTPHLLHVAISLPLPLPLTLLGV